MTPSTKHKRRKARTLATKFCVALTDTAADSRSTAVVTSAGVTCASPPGASPATNRLARST
jgi:hypothetical protein